MSSTPDLCGDCAKVPFEDLERNQPALHSTFLLATLSQIRNRECPFCQLVSACISTYLRKGKGAEDPEPEGKVVLWWFSPSWNYHAGFRVARAPPIRIGFCSTDGRQSQRVLRNLPAEVDLRRVTTWIEDCAANHKCVAHPRDVTFRVAFPGLTVLRLIDVVDGCLVETRELAKYVALSYVWGSVANLRLTEANRSHLMVPGILRDIPHHLPRTIRDAITLVGRLGLRFLWVDSLCLIQNNAHDLSQGVNVMDQIYHHAWLTIVAAHGHDANAGLPGIRTGDRDPHTFAREVKPGIFMGLCEDLESLRIATIYDTRAWTFQERILSQRVLYFFTSTTAFRCQAAEHLETWVDNANKSDASSYSSKSEVIMDAETALRMSRPLLDYSRILAFYSERILTYDSDVLRAMAGIMRRFSKKYGYEILQGLPSGALDEFVLFKGMNLRRRPGFASYSWVGWRGKIRGSFPTTSAEPSLERWLWTRTFITWYKQSPSGSLSHIQNFGEWSISGRQEPRPPRQFQCRLLSSIGTSQTIPKTVLPRSVHTDRPYPLLRFLTMTVFLTISGVDPFNQTARLVGQNGREYGQMALDGFEDTVFFETETPVDIILLSRTDEDRAAYHVMLVEWDESVAERRGIGILEEALVESFPPGPVWKEIVLG